MSAPATTSGIPASDTLGSRRATASARRGTAPARPRKGNRVGEGIAFVLITGVLAAAFLYPLLWAVISSFAPRAGTSQTDGWGLGNYQTLAGFQAGIWTYLLNSFVVSGLAVILTLGISFLGGYDFARFQFPGKNALFVTTIAILMVPYATLLIPLYVILNAIGLGDSLVGVALVLTMFQLPFSTFMMRNSFEAVPRELDEAAFVDGCTTFSALWRVLIHAVKPGLVTVGLFAFLTAWNDFIAPLILISDTNRMTLPLAVANLRGQTMGVIDYGATLAGVTVLALPCAALFLLLQRHYVNGFMSGAFKG
jgi:multiple sugar transport system permease protein